MRSATPAAALTLLCCVPARGSAQGSSHALVPGTGPGFAVQSDTRDDHLSRLGPVAAGQLAWLPRAPVGGRVQLGCHPPTGPVAIVSTSAHLIVRGEARARRSGGA